MLVSMVWGLNCVIFCGVLVLLEYIPNIVACADMSNDSFYGILRCVIALLGFFGFGCPQPALCRLWPSPMAFLILLSCTTIIAKERMLYMWCPC